MSTILFRIEHPEDELGVFRSGSVDDNDSFRIDNHSNYQGIVNRWGNFPSYWWDHELYTNNNKREDIHEFKFGFNNQNDINNQFEIDDLKELVDNLGFQIYKIEVKECISSKYQVIFKEEDILNKVNITQYMLIKDE